MSSTTKSFQKLALKLNPSARVKIFCAEIMEIWGSLALKKIIKKNEIFADMKKLQEGFLIAICKVAIFIAFDFYFQNITEMQCVIETTWTLLCHKMYFNILSFNVVSVCKRVLMKCLQNLSSTHGCDFIFIKHQSFIYALLIFLRNENFQICNSKSRALVLMFLKA